MTMETNLSTEQRNSVLLRMADLVAGAEREILQANQMDMQAFDQGDLAMYDRLKVDGQKVAGMVLSLKQLAEQEDPVGRVLFRFTHDNGLEIANRTAPFGTVMIIYESRPDVTIEAGGIAFKSGNRILLKGGKESLHSNLAIVSLWHQALQENGISTDWVTYLDFDRKRTQEYLQNPDDKIDLIIPRGGEKLIEFVRKHATCPVVVSGRGNNFVFVHQLADKEMALRIIRNAKTDKISACNALDKVLIDNSLPGLDAFLQDLARELDEAGVELLLDKGMTAFSGASNIRGEQVWYEEFLDYRILIGLVSSVEEAVEKVNKYSGGHSASIVTADAKAAEQFMAAVDSAAVYHNASTRFTDGFQFGLGGELAISTDKLHQRGPMGLQHLVTNKWYIYGTGQIR